MSWLSIFSLCLTCSELSIIKRWDLSVPKRWKSPAVQNVGPVEDITIFSNYSLQNRRQNLVIRNWIFFNISWSKRLPMNWSLPAHAISQYSVLMFVKHKACISSPWRACILRLMCAKTIYTGPQIMQCLALGCSETPKTNVCLKYPQ